MNQLYKYKQMNYFWLVIILLISIPSLGAVDSDITNNVKQVYVDIITMPEMSVSYVHYAMNNSDNTTSRTFLANAIDGVNTGSDVNFALIIIIPEYEPESRIPPKQGMNYFRMRL